MRSWKTASGGLSIVLLFVAGCASANAPVPSGGASGANVQWAVTMDNIEACSCPAFCQCYFSGQPALHQADKGHAERFCRFNNAFRINSGHFGETSLDGLKFWMAGDLGGDFSAGQMDWAVLRFEPSAAPEQRKAVETIVRHVFPVQWNSWSTGQDAAIVWQKTDDDAVARLNEGKSAEIVLKQSRNQGGKASTIENAQFWAAKSGPFLVMKNQVEAYREGDKPFEFKGTNGFFCTVQMSSADAAPTTQARATLQRLQLASGERSCCK